jgi:hypothetical protein
MPTRYSNFREALNPSLGQGLTDEQIESLFVHSAIEAADVEGFFSDLQRVLPQVAQVALPIAQAALPIVGTAIGGPVGGAIGGVASQALGSLAQPRRPPPPAGAPPAPPPAGAPPAPPGLAAGSPAAGQLLQLLGDPRTLQSLLSMALGPSTGTPNVPGTQAPVSAVASALSTLAAKAFGQAEAAAIPSGRLPEYLYREGVLAVDPGSPEQRAERLMEVLRETVPPPPTVGRGVHLQVTEASEFYDDRDDLANTELLLLLEEEGADLEFYE